MENEKQENHWATLYRKYYGITKTDKSEKPRVGMTYDKIQQLYRKKVEVVAEEPVIPNEEYQKEMELVKQYEVENAKLEETVNDAKSEYNDITSEEIEEFKRLNGITDNVEQPTETVEQPTETKVKSVKVSKPKEPKPVKEKPVKEQKEKVEKQKPEKEAKKKEIKPRKPKK